MIREQEDKYNWNFIYLGANQDSFAVGQSLGFAQSKVMNYTNANAGEVMRNFSGKLTSMRCATNDSYQALNKGLEALYTEEDEKVLNAPVSP